MNNITTFLKELKNNKKISLYIAIVLIILIICLVLFGQKTTKETSENVSYIEQMESKLVLVLENIEDCGKVSVAISYKSNEQKVYAYETQTNKTNGTITEVSSIITVKGEPLVLKNLPPEILGVVVVAQGADNPIVKLRIIQAVETLLGVEANNIQVFTYKS